MNILFVCTGNTCRSPMAEGILRDLGEKAGLDIQVKSAGIATFNGGVAAKNSIEAMKDINIDISQHRTLQTTEELIENSDLILTMGVSHKMNLILEYELEENKVFTLLEYVNGREEDIKDPFGSDYNNYLRTRDEIYQAIELLVKKLK